MMRAVWGKILLVGLIAVAAMPARGQDDDINPAAKSIARAARLPAYDIISIHQNRTGGEDSSLDTTRDGVVMENASLPEMVEFAYKIASFDLISGGLGAVGSDRFDIRAKVASRDGERPVKMSDDDFQAMTISLLADRFHLQVRLVPKKMTIYEVVVAKGGPKFELNETGTPRLNSTWGRDNTLHFQRASMSMLAGVLSDSGMHRLVVDRTGLKGAGDFTLRWSSDVTAQDGGRDVVSIYTAIQDQLGLKLQSVKLPVDTLVIEHVEQPSEN